MARKFSTPPPVRGSADVFNPVGPEEYPLPTTYASASLRRMNPVQVMLDAGPGSRRVSQVLEPSMETAASMRRASTNTHPVLVTLSSYTPPKDTATPHDSPVPAQRSNMTTAPAVYCPPADGPTVTPSPVIEPDASLPALLLRNPGTQSLALYCPQSPQNPQTLLPRAVQRYSQQFQQPLPAYQITRDDSAPSARGRHPVREVSERLYPRKYSMGRSHSPSGRGFKPWHYGPRYCGFPPLQPVPKVTKKHKEELSMFHLDVPLRVPPERLTVFVIGGPGSGKGTQCTEMVKNYGFLHISSGQLLRNEVECGTDIGVKIERIMAAGRLVPSHIPLNLILDTMDDSDNKYVLIDGYPRSVEQIDAFETEAGKPDLVLYLDCPTEVMQQRLLKRHLLSKGEEKRTDDLPDTVQKRLETFQNQTGPVIAFYQEYPNSYMLETINSTPSPFDVFQSIAKIFEERFALKQKGFDHSQHNCKKRITIFVLGGPGSGKGTQCMRMVKEFGYTHLSTGDLMRAEVKSKSELGKECESIMAEGRLVPLEITVRLLNKAMDKAKCKRFLIDGFPRSLEQAVAFEEKLGKPNLVLCLDCSLELMQKRLVERGLTSGREDDNIDTITKRFETFMAETQPVVDYYRESQPRVVRMIPTDKLPQDVYTDVRCALRSTVEKA